MSEELDFVVEEDMFYEDEYMRSVEDHRAMEEFATYNNLLRYRAGEDEFRWF